MRFSQASVRFEFRDGRAELSNGVIDSTASRALVDGNVDLGSRHAALRLSVRPTSPASATPIILDLNGPLQKLSFGLVTPGQSGAP